MQSERSESLSIDVTLGWIMLLLILTVMFVFTLVSTILAGDNFQGFHEDPGPVGAVWLTFLFAFYAVMPLLVQVSRVTGNRAIRWALMVFECIFLLLFLLHHISHWRDGTRSHLVDNVLEFSHHAIAIWLIYTTFKWARLPESKACLPQ